MFGSSNLTFLSKCCASLPNVISARTIAQIPIWENHIRFDQRYARKRPCYDVLDRFKRLNSGMWIRTIPAKDKRRYMKNEMFNETCDDYVTCTKEQCVMLDRMMTPFWLRKRYYVDDPYEAYNIRHGIDSPRVDDSKQLVRERRKVLLDDTTADKFFGDSTFVRFNLYVEALGGLMKLFSILIIYKNPTTNQTIVLKSAAELSSFSYFYRKSAGEFMQFSGKMIAERSAAPSRSSIKENEYLIHCFVRHDNLTGICVTDGEYQARVAFSLLNKILVDFSQKIPQLDWSRIIDEKDCKYDKLPEYLAQWQNPNGADALTRVQDEVEETKIVLHNTMQSVLERGERLDDLVKASENLSNQSKMFYTQARKMNKCCNYI